MTNDEILLIASSEPEGEQVREAPLVWRVLAACFAALFVSTVRDETSVERSRRLRITALEDAVKGLTNDIDILRKEATGLKAQIVGAAKCIAFHESKWEAMKRIQELKGVAKQ